jgi:cobalamin synthase
MAALVTGLLAWLTRGLHLDGVADLADGFGGSFEPARRLAIMKDSSTGAFGVVALVVLLLVKTASLFHLFDYGVDSLPILLMAPIAARFWMLVTATGATFISCPPLLCCSAVPCRYRCWRNSCCLSTAASQYTYWWCHR